MNDSQIQTPRYLGKGDFEELWDKAVKYEGPPTFNHPIEVAFHGWYDDVELGVLFYNYRETYVALPRSSYLNG